MSELTSTPDTAPATVAVQEAPAGLTPDERADLVYVAERWASSHERSMIHCGNEVLRLLGETR